MKIAAPQMTSNQMDGQQDTGVGRIGGRITDKSKGDIDETIMLRDLDLNFVFRLQQNWFPELMK